VARWYLLPLIVPLTFKMEKKSPPGPPPMMPTLTMPVCSSKREGCPGGQRNRGGLMSNLTARLADGLRAQKSARGTDAYLVIPPGDIVSLSVGDPDLPPPAHVIRAAHEALDAGRTRYTHWQGQRELRVAIADKLRDAAESTPMRL
jgi:hypothetical protein